jgi:hypothetical protein
MPALVAASDGENATAAALRNVAAGVTLADAVDALRSLDPATPAGACMACTTCATLALLLRRPEGAACAALACVNCPQDAARQAEASALGAEAALLRTLQAGAGNAGVAVHAAWAIGALCGDGHSAALAPATAAACVAALTCALEAHVRKGMVIMLTLATALTALFDNTAAVCAAAQCDTAAALFTAVQLAALAMPPVAAPAADLTHFERLGDALTALLDATDDAGVCTVAEARGGAAVTTTLAALHGTLREPHTAARFANVLALLCKPSAGARRAALASTWGSATVAAVCTLLKRSAELHITAPLSALSVLLYNNSAEAVAAAEEAASLARAAGAQAAVLAALCAHPGDAQLASCAVSCIYFLVVGDEARSRAARDAGAIQLIATAMEAHDGAPTVAADWNVMCSSALCAVSEAAAGDASAADARAVARAALRVLRTHAHLNISLANAAVLLHNARRRKENSGGRGSGGAARAELARLHADAIVPITTALTRHASSLMAATNGLRALSQLMDCAPANEDAALAAGAGRAAVAAMRAHAGDGLLQQRALDVLSSLALRPDISALLDAGAPAAAVNAFSAHHAFGSVSPFAMMFLMSLLRNGRADRAAHAAAAAAGGALEAAAHVLRRAQRDDDGKLAELAMSMLHALVTGHAGNAAHAVARIPDVRSLLDDVARVAAGMAPAERNTRRDADALATALSDALAAHDAAAACAAPAACMRCAEQRREGGRCGLAACGARRRHEQPGKGLLRCSSCLAAAYCCGEHQREAWAAHKPACREARAAAAAAAAD